jgi:dihydrofolate reductase
MISLIVAMSRNRVIGRDGKLPWHLPDDLQRFKAVTMGKPIVMGRKTYESIGRPLPGRRNIIVTRNAGYRADGCTVVHSIEDALRSIVAEEVMIIGGATLYGECLPAAARIYLTRVDAEVKGDVSFPVLSGDWRESTRTHHPADERHRFDFDFVVLERRASDRK